MTVARWSAAAVPALRLAGLGAIAGGLAGAVAATALLATRAGSPEEALRAVRVGWVVWLAGVAGIAEDHGERLVAPTSPLERLLHRFALGAALSAVAVVVMLAGAAFGPYDVPVTRPVAECAATFLVVYGLSALFRTVAPPGRTAVLAAPALALLLATDLLVPPGARIWPPRESAPFAHSPVAWLVGGAALTAAAWWLAAGEGSFRWRRRRAQARPG